MVSAQPPRDLPAEIDERLRQEILDVLADVVEWRLAPARWSIVEGRLVGVARALRDGDIPALREAVYELAFAGPVRGGFDDPPVVEPPEQVRSEVVDLVHTLDPEVAGQ